MRNSDAAIRGQIDILNQKYKDSGISFTLKNTSRTVDAQIFYGATSQTSLQDQMKHMLHKGDAKALNIYSTSLRTPPPGYPLNSVLFGYATFPDSYQCRDWDDGVVLNMKTIPGVPGNYGQRFGLVIVRYLIFYLPTSLSNVGPPFHRQPCMRLGIG